MLIVSGGAEARISALGARYSHAPTCREAVQAQLDWLSALEPDQLGIDMVMDEAEWAEAQPHVQAFLRALASGLFMERAVPVRVEVPGRGHWSFVSDSTGAARLP
jgi:hypothetical protein